MRAFTAYLLLLNLIFGEATAVARTIKQRTYENSQFLKGNRRQQHAATDARSSSSSGGSIAIASNVAVAAAATSPAVVLPTLLVEKVAANAHVATSAHVATTAQLGVGCFGICTSLIIFVTCAAAAGGAVAASAQGLSDATGALAQLNAVVDANGEFQVGNCFNMRNLVFSLEMSQVAFNILFQDAQVSQFIPLEDQENIDGERLTQEYWTCENMEDDGAPVDESITMPIIEMIDGNSHSYTSLSSEEFYNMHPLECIEEWEKLHRNNPTPITWGLGTKWGPERIAAVSCCFDSFLVLFLSQWIHHVLIFSSCSCSCFDSFLGFVSISWIHIMFSYFLLFFFYFLQGGEIVGEFDGEFETATA
jgi:hypothetical protein